MQSRVYENIRAGRPVMVNVHDANKPQMWDLQGNELPIRGHWMTIVGYRDRGAQVIVRDPLPSQAARLAG
jgi:hypothetical protein